MLAEQAVNILFEATQKLAELYSSEPLRADISAPEIGEKVVFHLTPSAENIIRFVSAVEDRVGVLFERPLSPSAKLTEAEYLQLLTPLLHKLFWLNLRVGSQVNVPHIGLRKLPTGLVLVDRGED